MIEFKNAIRQTWEAIASDAIDADPSLERARPKVIAEIVLDADRVEMVLTGDARTRWKEFIKDKPYKELLKFATDALKDYV